MTTSYYNVLEFLRTFDQEVPTEPCIPSLAVRKLHAKLVLEEALELIRGLGFEIVQEIPEKHPDYPELDSTVEHIFSETTYRFEELHEPSLIEILDGHADLDYVSTGTLIACGIQSFQASLACDAVHNSNMSKLWTEDETNTQLKEGYSCKLVSTGKINNERCWLVKDKDSKVIKSPSYSPANLKYILEP